MPATARAHRPAPAKTHRLANGLVLLAEPSEAFQSAAFTMMLPAGCRYDADDRLGLASLTCEMTLRGAGDRDSRQFVDDLDALGVERGESVGVSAVTLSGAAIAENLPEALAIYADVVRRPHLPADQLEAGRQVCLQELRGVEDEPGHKLMSELRARHYPSPWGRPSFGDEAGVRAATIDDVRAFHARRYRPEGAILAVAGAVRWEPLCELVERLLGDWRGAAEDPPPAEVAPTRDADLPYESAQSHIGVAFASTPYKHPDYFQAWSAVGVLSGGMSSRLFTEVREKRGLCYTVSASLHTQVERAAVFCYAGTTAERAQETLDVVLGELDRLADGVTPDELARLKARITSSLILQQESTGARAGALARDWRHLGRVRPLDELRALIDAVTADTINEYLTRNPPRDYTVVTLGPAPLARREH